MTKVAEINRSIYETPGVAELFRSDSELTPAERLLIDSLKEEVKDQQILEIGVGAGRITPYLTALTKEYIGIDCSKSMLDVARQKFAGTNFLVCAAEKMPMFEDERFAAVVFWGNGIDEVEHEERIFILREINRVLRKGGIFSLSAHNFDWRRLIRLAAFDGYTFRRGPVHLVSSLPQRLWIYLSCKVIRFFALFSKRNYAIFSLYGDAPNSTTPVYHISSDAQIRQLMSAGFEQIQAFASSGVALSNPTVHVDHNGRMDFELFYISRKS
jgi:ubiquinone/menaquinone biosynthesis C-methylase UbiE